MTWFTYHPRSRKQFPLTPFSFLMRWRSWQSMSSWWRNPDIPWILSNLSSGLTSPFCFVILTCSLHPANVLVVQDLSSSNVTKSIRKTWCAGISVLLVIGMSIWAYANYCRTILSEILVCESVAGTDLWRRLTSVLPAFTIGIYSECLCDGVKDKTEVRGSQILLAPRPKLNRKP